jgi:CRISPR-associated endonuclease/helicase Cas3
MESLNLILAKSRRNGNTPLIKHLRQVSIVAEKIALHLGLNPKVAILGAILHDIGKVSPLFQQTLSPFYASTVFDRRFRHEIASLFFLSVVPEKYQADVIEMIVAHHKSIYLDAYNLGLLDLDINSDNFEYHAKGFNSWSKEALQILQHFGIKTRRISLKAAKRSYEKAVDYCKHAPNGISFWRGLLMAADHLCSALPASNRFNPDNLFKTPDLSFLRKKRNDHYPLSTLPIPLDKRHTIVRAPTGSGKTYFLLRCCKNRVFYVLPYQAAINAMYKRLKKYLKNTDTDIRVLHAASALTISKGNVEEKILQRHIGAAIKILTPHQLISIVAGTKKYEAEIVDVKGCDIILDEIHTYTATSQALVIKLVEILVALGCNIHVGSATMSTVLYKRILAILGKADTNEVSLSPTQLDRFNRHIIHKADSFEACIKHIEKYIRQKKKVLIVANQINQATNWYDTLVEKFRGTPGLLIHSEFKRHQRHRLEHLLQEKYNKSKDACICVSTQVVEVSLDISFDLLITACAPIDALIQRLGRINRVLILSATKKHAHAYIIKPPVKQKDAYPYRLNILRKTYKVLKNNALLKERNMQSLIDEVYPKIPFSKIDLGTTFHKKKWMLKKLTHKRKSALLEQLKTSSLTCIQEKDKEKYLKSDEATRTSMEIPVSYDVIAGRGLPQLKLKRGSNPFVIPDKAYSNKKGLLREYLNTTSYLHKTSQPL